MFGITLKGTIEPNVRVIALPVLGTLFLVVLTIIAIKTGIVQIANQAKDLKQARITETILESKLELLKQLGGEVLSDADVTAIALPEKNPGIITLYHLSSLAMNHNVLINDRSMKVSPSNADTDTSMGELTIAISGDLASILDLVKEVKTIAPLVTLQKIYLQEEGDVILANADLTVYWSVYPEKLPPLTEPITDLTEEEKVLFEELQKLSKPEFVELLPSSPSLRVDPFN